MKDNTDGLAAHDALLDSLECHGYVVLGLSGELDITNTTRLRAALTGALDSARFVFVDLSGVSFLDSSCLRELIVYHQLYEGRLALCRPSEQVKLSVAATEYEDWVTFHPDEEKALQALYDRASGTSRQRREHLPEDGGGRHAA